MKLGFVFSLSENCFLVATVIGKSVSHLLNGFNNPFAPSPSLSSPVYPPIFSFFSFLNSSAVHDPSLEPLLDIFSHLE